MCGGCHVASADSTPSDQGLGRFTFDAGIGLSKSYNLVCQAFLAAQVERATTKQGQHGLAAVADALAELGGSCTRHHRATEPSDEPQTSEPTSAELEMSFCRVDLDLA